MVNCPVCGASAAEQNRFCASCGAPLVADGETRLVTTPSLRTRGTPHTGFTPPTDFDHGRFVPGLTLANRYRIIGRIGRGGMGEVYRADDLRLGQQVALKFLPEDLAHDASRLAQFHAEVRLARQVSHPNVCRVYDIDEDEGRTFLSMEYIDGEDLASLLRRIGRLPADKALELSRQLCAGLAAAHERGVIHRDLKPPNLMIDGEGRLRITDFGIAAVVTAGAPAAGTPGYMAPELLMGAPPTVQSDLYALGLVLYELFTGRKAFAQSSLAEIVRAQQDTQPTAPTAYVRDLDPAVERTILRCLNRDPAQRPASALSVSAMLPGGDPLAAALAAGETPSPQLVAAAGEAEALAPAKGAALFLAVIVGLIAVVLLADRTFLPNLLSLDKPPAVLQDRAAEILAHLGYADRIGQAQGFSVSDDYLRYIVRTDKSRDRWRQLGNTRGPSAVYWFRISPRTILPMSSSARPGLHDPPMTISGQAGVILDLRGRLVELHGVPPQFEETTTPAPSPDWKLLFDAAQLDMARFTPAAPAWTPRQYADTRAAWTGTVPEHPGVTLRVDAAAYRGRPVFFTLSGPWTEPSRMRERQRSRTEVVLSTLGSTIVIALIVGAVLLAWRNARRGRGDRKGTLFFALLIAVCSAAAGALRMTHAVDPGTELNRVLLVVVSLALLDFGLIWALYMAVEPSIRRLWPDALMGWSRLVSGRVRDARVGRDILYGVVVGIVIAFVGIVHDVIPPLFGGAPSSPTLTDPNMWLGARMTIGDSLLLARNSIQSAGIGLFVIVLLRMIFRSRVAAIGVAILVFLIIGAASLASSETPLLDLGFALALVAIMMGTIVRLGLLTTIVAIFFSQLLTSAPLTSSFTAWYGMPSTWAVTLALATAAAGFWLSRGNAPLFGRTLLDDRI